MLSRVEEEELGEGGRSRVQSNWGLKGGGESVQRPPVPVTEQSGDTRSPPRKATHMFHATGVCLTAAGVWKPGTRSRHGEPTPRQRAPLGCSDSGKLPPTNPQWWPGHRHSHYSAVCPVIRPEPPWEQSLNATLTWGSVRRRTMFCPISFLCSFKQMCIFKHIFRKTTEIKNTSTGAGDSAQR